MSQILRAYKLEIPILARSYARSPEPSHYDTLKISPNATQKEIKEAFFKRSKEVHPDKTGKRGHADFVKLNEAYSVLGKQHTRNQYDMSLRRMHEYGTAYHNTTVHSYQDLRRAYGFPDPETVRRSNPNQRQHIIFKINPLIFCLVIMFVGFLTPVYIVRFSPLMDRRKMLERSRQLEREYEERKRRAMNRTPEEEEEFIRNLLREYEERLERAKNGPAAWEL